MRMQRGPEELLCGAPSKEVEKIVTLVPLFLVTLCWANVRCIKWKVGNRKHSFQRVTGNEKMVLCYFDLLDSTANEGDRGRSTSERASERREGKESRSQADDSLRDRPSRLKRAAIEIASSFLQSNQLLALLHDSLRCLPHQPSSLAAIAPPSQRSLPLLRLSFVCPVPSM